MRQGHFCRDCHGLPLSRSRTTLAQCMACNPENTYILCRCGDVFHPETFPDKNSKKLSVMTTQNESVRPRGVKKVRHGHFTAFTLPHPPVWHSRFRVHVPAYGKHSRKDEGEGLILKSFPSSGSRHGRSTLRKHLWQSCVLVQVTPCSVMSLFSASSFALSRNGFTQEMRIWAVCRELISHRIRRCYHLV